MWKSMAAASGGLGLIGLARSQYERKALSVETVRSERIRSGQIRPWYFFPTCMTMNLGRIMCV